jgi:hypothetical protein
MNEITNEKNNQQFEYDYSTQREYATKGQLRIEQQEEEENNLLIEIIVKEEEGKKRK